MTEFVTREFKNDFFGSHNLINIKEGEQFSMVDENGTRLSMEKVKAPTWRQVRIYDGEGNLKEIVEPVFNYKPQPIRNKKKAEEHMRRKEQLNGSD